MTTPRETPTNSRPEDEDLARAVTEALAWDSRLHYPQIRVAADAGVIYMSGMVERLVERIAAEEDAARIAGVTQVVSNIVTRPDRPVSDDAITRAVTGALHRDARTHTVGIGVETRSRIVTLRGEVANAAQKRAAVEVAGATYGVEGVLDEITILPHPLEADQALENLATAALRLAPGLDSERLAARVSSGVAHVTGSVDFLYQRRLVEQIVEDVPGIIRVINEVTVSPAGG